MNEGANKPAALRCPHHECFVICPVDGICRLGVVFRLVLEKSCEITHRREAKTEHERILGAVDKLVDLSRLKARRQTNLPIAGNRWPILRTSTETPVAVANWSSRILLLGPDAQRWQKPIGKRGPIVEADRGITGVVQERKPAAGQVQRFGRSAHNELATNQPGNGRTIGV